MKIIVNMLFWLLMIIPAAFCAYVLGSFLSTQFVLGAHNVDVTFGERIAQTLADINGMRLYFIIILIGFFFAFLIAAGMKRILPGLAKWAYPIAGMAAILTALGLMYMQFDTVPISGGRSIPGFVAQLLAGGFGGFIFAKLLGLRKQYS